MRIDSFLPVFPGFYNTIFEADESSAIEEGRNYDDYDWDYADYNERVAKACTEFVEKQLDGYGIRVVYQGIQSPKLYNCSNDVILVEYVTTTLKHIRGYIDNYPEEFQKYPDDNFTRGPGFSSFYSTDVAEWRKNFTEKDRIGHVLDFILFNEDPDAEESTHHAVSGQLYVGGTLKEEETA